MAKLPSSFRAKNRTTRQFREQYGVLPPAIRDAVRQACVLFERNPSHRSLRLHELRESKRGDHAPSTFSVSVTMQYRALFIVVEGINVWYWIGSHAQYNRFTGSSA